MDLKKHYFMTFAALFFLGLIVAKPGETFTPTEIKRECKLDHGKIKCEYKVPEYQINSAVIYHYK